MTALPACEGTVAGSGPVGVTTATDPARPGDGTAPGTALHRNGCVIHVRDAERTGPPGREPG